MYLVAVFGVILSVWLLVPQTLAAPVASSADKTPWKLHEALSAGGQVKGFNGTWISENEFYYTAADRTIHIFNAETLKDRVLVSDELLEAYSGGTFILSPDTKRILIRYGLEQVFRHSYIAKYDIYVIESSEIKKIHGGEKLQLCTWATVGERLSYVFNNNVYVRLEDGRELQITTDGVNGEVYNGIADWVYEEEVLSTSRAMWWSPDATLMAVASFNDTGVQTFSYTIYGESEDAAYQYPKEEKLKYPKPGTPNPIVSLKVYDLSTPSPTVESIPAPVGIVSADHILQSVVWSGKEALLVTWLNRRQNLGTIQSCTKRGVCREVTPLAEPKGWVSVSQPKCLSNENNCLLLNWIGNWYQIWNVDLATGKNVWSSRGDFTVTGLYGYDEAKDQVYYQATLQGDPSQYHIYRSGTCLSCHLKDADGETCRQASATFSKDFSFYTITCTGPGPSYTSVFNAADTAIKPWQLNTEFRDYLEQKLQPTVKYLNVSLGGGFTGYARLALPPGLNWDNPDKSVKYPMIVNVYGGPNSVRANSAFRVGYEAYVVTKRNIIYATIDGRGTGNKGKDLLFTVNNNLGEHEVEDQIGVAKQLQEAYSFIDASRTAIWGWSYGGYVSAKTLANDTKNVFQCGVSVAPVTSWIYYDSIYTERYMGLPTDEDNLINYHYSSIMENVENFKTHDFLLIHGSGDDNVHYQQSLMLARVLQRKDILFSQMTYTDESHSIGNFLPHLYNTIDSFFSDCLGIEASNDDDEDNDVSG